MPEAHDDAVEQALEAWERMDRAAARIGSTQAADMTKAVQALEDARAGMDAAMRKLVRRRAPHGKATAGHNEKGTR